MNFNDVSNCTINHVFNNWPSGNTMSRLAPSSSSSKKALATKFITANTENMVTKQLSSKMDVEMKSSTLAPSSKSCFDDESKVSQQHKAMRVKIVSLLKNKMAGIYGSEEESKRDIGKFAEDVEQLLYRTAPDFESYSDISTCDRRLRLLLTRLLKRRLRQGLTNHV